MQQAAEAEIRRMFEVCLSEMLGVSRESIKGTSTLESLGADSLDKVELLMELEELYKVDIDDDEAKKLEAGTVDECVAALIKVVELHHSS